MFNNPFSMVVAIVLIIAVAKVLRAKYSNQHLQQPSATALPNDHAENARLRDELRALKDRIVVLERLTTDNHSAVSLDREIEQLRDR